LLQVPEVVTWDDVHGVDHAKESAADAVDALAHPEDGLDPGGLLLTGPGGTGKSLLAKAIAHEVSLKVKKCSLFKVDATFLVKGAPAAQCSKITALFSVAKEGMPSIIFFDECDGAMGGDAATRIKHMKDVWDPMEKGLPLVIGATNKPDKIAPELKQRFGQKEIEFSLPDKDTRIKILRSELGKLPNISHELSDPEWNAMGEATEGLAGRRLAFELVASAARAYNRMHRGKSERPPLRASDLVARLDEKKRGAFTRALRAASSSGVGGSGSKRAREDDDHNPPRAPGTAEGKRPAAPQRTTRHSVGSGKRARVMFYVVLRDAK
jgi:AAA+ superfamily predicted ATPase